MSSIPPDNSFDISCYFPITPTLHAPSGAWTAMEHRFPWIVFTYWICWWACCFMFYFCMLALVYLGITSPPSLRGISQIVFIFLCPQSRVTWFFSFSALVGRYQKPFTCSCSWFCFPLGRTSPISSTHLSVCHALCFHCVTLQVYWVAFASLPTSQFKVFLIRAFNC